MSRITTAPQEEWLRLPQFMMTGNGKPPKRIVVIGAENSYCQLHGEYIKTVLCYATVLPDGFSGLRSIELDKLNKLELCTGVQL